MVWHDRIIVIDTRLDNTVNLLVLQIKQLRTDINQLDSTLTNFTEGVQQFNDQLHTIKEIHRELLKVLRSMSFVQSEVPTLLNGMVNMATETMAMTAQVRDDMGNQVSELNDTMKQVNIGVATLAKISISLVVKDPK